MRRIKNHLITAFICLCVYVGLCIPVCGHSGISIINSIISSALGTTWSYTYDTATPAGSDDPAEADDRMREIKAAIQERMNVCGYWPLTGTEVSDADAGEIRRILFHAPIASTPTVAADHGDLRLKDVSSKAELHWTDEDENELQLTSMGNNVANNTYITATNAAGSGSVDLIKADANDVAVLPDGAKLATSAAPDANSEIANKKYVDDQVSLSTHTNEDSESNTIIKAHAYKAASDGFVSVYAYLAINKNVILYIGDTNDPAGAGDIFGKGETGGNHAEYYSFCAPVAKDQYFEVTSTIAAPIIYWRSMGTLAKPIDQD